MQMRGHRPGAPDKETGQPSWQSAFAVWLWPLAGTLAIAMIVTMVIQSPELARSLRNMTNWGQDERLSAAPTAGTTAPDKTILTGESTEKPSTARPERTGRKAPRDVARLRLDLSRLNDTLERFETMIKRQNRRIAQLEGMLGPITGSIPARTQPGPRRRMTVSKHAKTAIRQKPQTTTKSGQLVSSEKPPSRRVTDIARSPYPAARARIAASLAPKKNAPAPLPPAANPAPGKAAAPVPAAHKPLASAVAEKPITDTRVATLARDNNSGTVSATRFAVRLAQTRKRMELDEIWEKILRSDLDELGRLTPYVRSDTTARNGEKFTLLAGPFDDMAEALELCVRLKIKGIPCEQTLFSGTPLDN